MLKDVISMTALASKKIGKGFGNKLFQYAFLKTYARKSHLQVEVPEWIGRFLFGHQDPYISRPLPAVMQVSPSLELDPIPNTEPPYKNVDFVGYFQYHTQYFAPFKEYIRSLFQPVPEIHIYLDKFVKQLRTSGKTVIGVHLRRGDYEIYKNSKPFCFVPPNSWYLNFLHEVWDLVEEPVLFIACDEPDKVQGDFSSFHPITTRELGATIPEADYYPDFYMLTRCDLVAISNSTFSFMASMLNEKARLFMRPHPPDRALIPFDPWNSEVLYRTDLNSIRYSFEKNKKRQPINNAV